MRLNIIIVGFLLFLGATYEPIIGKVAKNGRGRGSTGSTRTIKSANSSNRLLSILCGGHANILLKEGIEDRFTIESNF